MKKINLIFKVVTLLLMINSCKNDNQTLLKIDIEAAIDSPSEIKCSDFIESIDYIMLETSDSCLINKSPVIFISDTDMVVQTLRDCFIFNSNTGDFKYRVGKFGRGPGEYSSTMQLFDTANKTIFFQNSGGQVLEYSLQNKLLKKIQLPDYDASFESPSIPTCFTIFNNWLVCYFSNVNGSEKKLLMGVNKDTGLPDFTVLNPHVFKNGKTSFSTGEASFSIYNNDLFFKEIYNDTIYHVSDGTLIPYAILLTGKNRFSYEMKFEGGYSSLDYLRTLNFFESKSFLGFRYLFARNTYFGIYSKNDKKLKVMNIEKGLPNDIDNFVEFKPTQSIADNTLIGVVEAYNIVKWFSDNPEKISQLPEQLQKLKNINENDNPVVMIAKLKE